MGQKGVKRNVTKNEGGNVSPLDALVRSDMEKMSRRKGEERDGNE